MGSLQPHGDTKDHATSPPADSNLRQLYGKVLSGQDYEVRLLELYE
jgi:hypothetical protein